MRVLAFISALLIAACGFHPVLQSRQGAVPAEMARIEVSLIPNRSGQMLRNLLMDRFGKSRENPLYRLDIVLTESISSLGLRKDATATRAWLNLGATFTLTETATGTVLLQGPAQANGSYNILDSGYGSFVTENDARKQAIAVLADNIATRLALHFDRQHP